jgi:hypothetical protein
MNTDTRDFCGASLPVVGSAGSSWLRYRHIMYVAAELSAISAAPAKPRGCKQETTVTAKVITEMANMRTAIYKSANVSIKLLNRADAFVRS